MKVREFKELLNHYPDDMTVIIYDMSDFKDIDPERCRIIQAVDQKSWYMHPHPTMSERNKRNETKYLLIDG